MAKLQYMTLANLTEYNDLLGADLLTKINEAVSPAIKTVSLSDDKQTLYFYTKKAPVTIDDAAFSIPLPAPVDISGKIDKVSNSTAGNLASLTADGSIADSGKKAADFASKSDISDLNAYVGTIPADSNASSVIEYAKEAADKAKADASYDDTELRAKVTANTDAVAILNGTGTGSVSKTVYDAVAEVVAGAPESMDTLKEISDWIQGHSSDAASMNSRIGDNKTDIDALKSLIGQLPEGSKAKTIIAYIAEYVTNAVGNIDLSKFALVTDLTAAVGRISKNEAAVTAINEAAAALTARVTTAETDIDTVEKGLKTANTNIGTNTSNIQNNLSKITALEGLVGDGFEPIPSASIRSLFNK